jgi:hypothetical protein
MRRLSHPPPRRPRKRAAAPPPDSPGTRTLDHGQRHAAADVVGEARCPLCRAPLVARMGRGGPCFPCRCPGWRGWEGPRRRVFGK